MKFLFCLTLLTFFLCWLISGCNQQNQENKKPLGQKGYVLKPQEGEFIFDDALLIVKASLKSGTQGSVMIYDEMARGNTSGAHYHLESDELFYVLEGEGNMLLGEEETEIESGYFIFVPSNEDHRITSSSENPLKVIYFLDKSGLELQFREEAKLKLDRTKMTVEEFNAIVKKYGTIYKSFN